MIHIIKRKFGNRLVLLAVMLFQTLMVAAADKVYISDFSIKPGETKTIAVNFDTDAENTRYIEGYIEIPEGLTVVNQNEGLGTAVKYISPNGERGVTNTSFSPNATKKVLVMSYVTITPGEGAVGYIKVAASSTLAATSTIIVRDFTASQNDNTKRTCQTGNATVTRETTDEEKLVFSFSPATLTMKAGEEKQVEVQMENGMSLTGLQSSLSVSDGLTITGVTKGERMTYGWYYSSETNNILHIGNITGNEGTVFTVSLKANSNFTGSGTLTVSNIHATTSESKDYAHADIVLPVTVGQAGNVTMSFVTAKVYLGAGESTTVDVNLTSDTDLTGFQCTLTLPDNITATIGKGALLNSTPLYNSETGNILYIDAVGINGHAGQLFTLTLTASDAFAADGTLTLTGIHSTTASSADIASEDITMQVAVKTAPSMTVPTAKTLTYNGTAQELVNAGTATGGELQYSLDGTNYSTTIPTATNAGNYTIYYRVVGDAAHNDVAAATLTATIAKAALTVTAEDKTVNYGEAAPEFTATYAGFVNNETAAVLTGTLAFDCDYTPSSNIGDYAITPKGLTAANYDITFVAGTLTITKAANFTITLAESSYIYDGTEKKPAVTVMDGSKVLTEGTDYTVAYSNNINASTNAKVTVTGKGNYDGTKIATFTISKAALTVTAEDMTVNYGEATPEFTATYAGFVNNETAAVLTGTLAFDCDYSKGSNVGTYAITPKGLTAANYDITFVAGTLTVNKAQLTSVTLSETNLTYTGSAQTVSVTSVMAGSLVVGANDYTVSGNTATEVGTYTVTVTAKEESNFTGSATAQWSIVASAPSTFVISSITPASFVYDGTEKKPTVTVMDGTTVLTEDTDYTVVYQNNVNAGTATVVVTGMGNYSGTQTATFTIAKAVLTSVTLVQTRLDYNGSEQSVSIASVKAGTLDVPATDYTVSGNTATEVGTYTVTVTAKEESNFTGSVCTDFEIVQNETPELKFAIVVTDENDEVIEGTTATVTTLDEGGNAVSIDKLNVPAGNEDKSLKVYIPEQLGGYDVAAIANNAFADKDVIDVFLPDTEKSLTVGSNAIPRLATIHTTLALLDDYALMATLKPNYEAHLVMTTVKPANNYWTLGTGVDVIIPAELTIATVQQKNASEVSVCNISEEDLNMGGKRVVKSNNGVLLEGTAGESYDLVAYSGRMASGTAITTDDHKDYGADNCLEPVVEKKHYQPGAYFVMSNNEFHAIKLEGEEIKVPAGKAVLHLTGSQSSYAPVLRLSFDSSADGINTAHSNTKEEVCYDMLGRRIQNGQQKGLIIKNGKKTIVSKR